MSLSNPGKEAITIGYWGIRGLVEPSRLVLHYTKTPYTDKFYALSDAPDFSREEWLSEKFNLGLDFPNIPYMFDGDVKITQSKAILYYLGRKFHLMGTTPTEEAHVLMLCEEVFDLRAESAKLFYGPTGGSDEERQRYADTTLSEQLKRFDDYFAKQHSRFAVGDQPTVADFQLYDYIDASLMADETGALLDQYPHLKRVLQTVEQLPELTDYILKSHAEMPINSKMAKYGDKVIHRQ